MSCWCRYCRPELETWSAHRSAHSCTDDHHLHLLPRIRAIVNSLNSLPLLHLTAELNFFSRYEHESQQYDILAHLRRRQHRRHPFLKAQCGTDFGSQCGYYRTQVILNRVQLGRGFEPEQTGHLVFQFSYSPSKCRRIESYLNREFRQTAFAVIDG